MNKSTKKLLLILIPAIATVLVGFFQFVLPLLSAKTPNDVKKSLVGRVADQQTAKAIQGAKVSLEGKGLSPVIYTDSEGRFAFPISSDLNHVTIRVDAEGYKPFTLRIDPSGKVEPEDIRLTLADPSPSPVEPVKQSKDRTSRELTLEEKKRRALRDLDSKNPTPNPD